MNTNTEYRKSFKRNLCKYQQIYPCDTIPVCLNLISQVDVTFASVKANLQRCNILNLRLKRELFRLLFEILNLGPETWE